MALKIAVIPWDDSGLNNRIFFGKDERDGCNEPFLKMKQEFERRGDSFHTIDLYDSLGEIDYFLFFELDWKWLEKVVKAGGEKRMIYCNAEPPVVNRTNSPEGYKFILKFFPYILTWNSEWIDNERIFRRNIPYCFKEDYGTVPLEEKKLITSISGNKHSTHPDELYSERERVITFFENNYPDDFDFYGTGWDKNKHPGYQGRVDKKVETFHKYKFAICFENMKNISDYVTEKILDCLTSGIVPVYAGAKNITDYVPEECFIDYQQFKNMQELADFLFAVDEERYNKYLEAAKEYIQSDKLRIFEGEEYARCIYDVLKKKNDFKISVWNKFYIWQYVRKSELKRKVKSIVKNNIRR